MSKTGSLLEEMLVGRYGPSVVKTLAKVDVAEAKVGGYYNVTDDSGDVFRVKILSADIQLYTVKLPDGTVRQIPSRFHLDPISAETFYDTSVRTTPLDPGKAAFSAVADAQRIKALFPECMKASSSAAAEVSALFTRMRKNHEELESLNSCGIYDWRSSGLFEANTRLEEQINAILALDTILKAAESGSGAGTLQKNFASKFKAGDLVRVRNGSGEMKLATVKGVHAVSPTKIHYNLEWSDATGSGLGFFDETELAAA